MFKKYLLFNLCFICIFLVALLQSSNLLPFTATFYRPAFTGTAAFMLSYLSRLRGRFHRRILIAFVSLLAGTLILDMTNDLHTMYVLFCFLTAQVYFVRAFYLDFSSAPELDKTGARVAIVLGTVFSFAAYLYLRPYFGAFRIPAMVCVFLTALVTMMATFRRLRVNRVSFNLILSASIVMTAGAVVFAIYYFIAKTAFNKFTVDAAYMIGIYLMVLGAVERKLVRVD